MPQRRIRPHVNPFSITKEYSFEGFGNANPIVVDVGACKGEFTEALLQKFPERNFIVFEIREPLYQKLKEKFAAFPNVVVFNGDAGRNFRTILKPSVERGVLIEQVFINFPDPWFKPRHKKRRFLNEKFLFDCAEWISPDTEFIFQTDQEFLFDETMEVLNESSFNLIEKFSTPPHGVCTDWETAKAKEGAGIFRIKFKKNSPPPV